MYKPMQEDHSDTETRPKDYPAQAMNPYGAYPPPTAQVYGSHPPQGPPAYGSHPPQGPLAYGNHPPQGPVAYGSLPPQGPVAYGSPPPQGPVAYGSPPPQGPVAYGSHPPQGPPAYGGNLPQGPPVHGGYPDKRPQPHDGYPNFVESPLAGNPVALAYNPAEISPPNAPVAPEIPVQFGEDGTVKGFDFTEKSIRRGFIRKVYSILMCQLLVTFSFVCLVTYHVPTQWFLIENAKVILISAFVVTLVCVVVLSCSEAARRKSPANLIFLGVFTAGQSVILGFVGAVYEPTVVMLALGLTVVICLALTLFAFQTRYDFTMMGGMLFCFLLILIVFGLLIGILGANYIMHILYASLGALLFSLYLVYDTQLMMGGNHKYSVSPEEYVFAALNLYLDIINLFLYILRLVAGRN